MAVKPPLGLTPRFIVDEKRLKDIDDAFLRYAIVQMEIPQEWRDERDEIVTRLTARYAASKKACESMSCRADRGEWTESMARVAVFGTFATCPVHGG